MDGKYSWKRTEDIEIDIRELAREICLQWKQALICAMVFAVILGGYGYLKSRSSMDHISREEIAEERELTEEEQQSIAEAAELRDEIQKLEVYLENSVLMQADAYHKDRVVMLYSIDQAKGRKVQKITESYLNFVLNGGAVNALKESDSSRWDMDSSLLAELISASQRAYSLPYQVLADRAQDWDIPAESLFYVEVTGKNARMAERLADNVHSVLKEYQDRVSNKAGKHRLTLLSREKCKQADSGLLSLQRDKKALLSANRTNLKAMTDSFSREQMLEYLDVENIEDPEELEEDLTDSSSRSSVKYILAGFICGIFLYCGVYVCLYLLRDTVKSAGEIRSLYTFPFYGSITLKRRKVPNADKYECGQAQTLSRIRLLCKKQGIKRLCAVSDFNFNEQERECMENIAARLKEWGIEILIAENGSVDTALWDIMAETGNVLMVYRIGMTTHRMIDEAMAFYLENDISVSGAIAFV